MDIRWRECYYEAQKLLQTNQTGGHIVGTLKIWSDEGKRTRIQKTTHSAD